MAHHLIGLGVRPNDCVAILLPRSIDLLTSQLAILKCAATYVPLDRNASLERQGFMLADCRAFFVLTSSSESIPPNVRRVDLDTLEPHGATHNPGLEQSSESIAYIMYTSGSTGQPKGVLVPHRAINRLVINNGYADFNEHDRIAFASNPAFDASTMDVWGALLNGGQVVVIDHETLLEPARFAQVLSDSGATVLFVTTAIFNQYVQLIPEAMAGLRILLCGGERADVASFRRLLSLAPALRLVHCYGPTETTTYATTLEVKAVAEDAQSVPIGGPISNTQVYVLDARQQLVPLGVVGEIYIGGKGVAKGYLNRPDLTAEKFIADPFSDEPGALLYRTGDLGRWLPEGSLECLGRNDDQVKIRGFRIELGEIEARLVTCAGVQDAVVMVRADESGEKRLVAYVVAQPEVTLTVAGLREQLSATLAEYMVPGAFVFLPLFPLTLNGKVDRKALPAPHAEAYASEAYEAPQGEIEQTLAGLWVDLLKVERVGRHDHFFELGGHSLLAMRLIERMRQAGLSVDVRDLFSQPTLRALAAAVGGHRDVVVPANAIVEGCERITPDMLPLAILSQEAIDRIVASVPGGAGNVQDIYPLAPLQEGILYHHLTANRGDPYVLQTLFGFDDRSRLDSFAQALQQVIDRHDILRTSMAWEGLDEPVQVVWRRAQLSFEAFEPEADGAEVVAQMYERFDARHYRLDMRQAPLLRLVFAEDVANQRWVAMLLFHHSVLDHTALEVLEREMQAHLLGRADHLGAAVPYRNYVTQARLGVSQEEHEGFFRDMLGDIDEPTLPFGLRDVQGDGNGVEEVKLALEAGLCRRLRGQARQLGVSAASLMHLAWAQVLGRVSGRDDVVFGTVLLGRMQGGEGADHALGMFINTLPLRVSLVGCGVREGVKTTHQRLTALLGHEHAPLALAQRCSGVVAPTPLFSAMLNYRHCSVEVTAQMVSAWQGIESIGGEERTNYPLTLAVDDEGEGFSLVVQVARGIGAQRIGEYMQTTLESLVTALEQGSDTPPYELESLPAVERQHLLEAFNATAVDYPQGLTLHGLFEAQALASPDGIAVVADAEQLSYAQLNHRANQIAHRLLALGIRPDDRVAVCMDRSTDMVAALLGILKAGAAYVPLDPDYPADRLAYMLENSAPAVVLIQRALQASLPATNARVMVLEEQDFATQPTGNPQVSGLHASHLAYVIYTSGSTGLPKGVMNEHGAVVNRLLWMQDAYTLSAADAVLQKTPFSFDVSVWEFFWPLFTGARLVMARPGGHRDPAYLREVIQTQGITTLHFVPSMLDVFLAHGEAGECEGLRQVMCSGEALPGHLVRRFKAQLPQTALHNLYGPTEAAVDVTAWDCSGAETPDSTPIGKPIANTRIYLLDAHQQPVPMGVAGEIYIGGVQVARGYLHRPELTAERFLADPFSDRPNARMYRTGDLGRYLADGNIDYLGRNDDQVKIRGFRIELGEIEAKLAQHGAIKEAVVLAREDVPGAKRLVAYFTVHGDEHRVEIESLRTQLQGQLPEYMVPAAYVQLEALPLTPNGKLDRKALPAPDLSSVITRDYEAPQGAVETTLAQLWAELLKVEKVGRHDHFFELGGHSLLAVTLIERMRQAGLSADVRVLFGQPTLAALAAAVGGATEIVVPDNGIVPGCERITPQMLPLADLTQQEIDAIVAGVPGGVSNVQDIYALAPLQEGILYHHLVSPQGDLYVQQAMFNLDDRARLDAFVNALQGVIDRHDILRTAVLWDGLREPVQVVLREASLAVQTCTVEPGQDVMAQLRERFDPRHYRLDVRQAPMMRLACAYDDEHQRWVALLLFHHIALDHTALEVIQHDMQAYLLGQQAQLGDAVPYRNYVAQARLGVTQSAHEAFFRDMLADIQEPTLPFGLQDVQGDSHVIEQARLGVDDSLNRRLRTQSRLLGVSAASLHHLAWARVVGAVSGREDVVFGTVLMGRMQGGEGADRALGLFINTLPLRVDVGVDGARAGVKTTHARLTALLGHEYASLALAQRCSGVATSTPLFSALLNYRHTATQVTQEAQSAWNGIEGLGGEEWSNYPLSLNIDDLGEGFVLTALAESRIGAERICGYMHTALESLVDALEHTPEVPLRELAILPAAERRQLLVDFNATDSVYPREETVHGLFEAQVRARPDGIALQHGAQRLTYRELHEQASHLAHCLLERGVQPGSRVAIMLNRSFELIISELAILKCAAVYVPLDHHAPEERQRFMLQDSAAVLVLTTSDRVLPEDMPRLDLDTLQLIQAARPAVFPTQTSDTPAYIMYTSGSTGHPKGVIVPHLAIGRLAINNGYADFGVQDRVAFASNPAFDASTMEVWGALLNGGRLVIIDHETLLSPTQFAQALTEAEVSVLFLTTAMFNQYLMLIPDALAGLRILLCGGERGDPASFRRLLAHAPSLRLLNCYGPTETTTFATTHAVTAVPHGATSVPIGRPIANTRVYILDAARQPVPVGVAGEIHIGGVGVALGYLNRADLTEERFIADPFSDAGGARLYRSGDLGRWLPDGTIEYLDRNDGQVKIRGFRIELGEIEARLHECHGVREALVVAREDSPGDKRLIAYYTEHEHGDGLDADALRAQLRSVLPEYMIPAAYVRLTSLPLTLNGKVNTGALPVPELHAYGRQGYEAPQGDLEVTLAGLWADVLKLEQVGRHDNFFELGGHSLLAIRLVGLLAQANLTVSLAELFQHESVASMAAMLQARTEDAQVKEAIVPVRTTGQQNPLFLVHEFSGLDLYFPMLGKHIDPDIPVYGLPAVEWGEPQLQTMECMASRLVGIIRSVQPEGPYRLAGWSFGGVLAYETAIQLIGLDEKVEFVGLIDSYLPRLVDQGRSRWALDEAHKLHLLDRCDVFWRAALPGEEVLAAILEKLVDLQGQLDRFDFDGLVQHCRDEAVLPAELAVYSAEQLWQYLDREVAHGHALAHYMVYPISVPVHLLVAEERKDDAPEHAGYLGWDAVLPTSQLHCVKVPGNHQSMMQMPHVQALGQAISAALHTVASRPVPSAKSGYQPLLTIQGGRADRAPIFCVPGAGDSVTGFIGLTDAFGPDWPIHGLQHRGLDGSTEPFSLVETAAQAYLEAIDKVQPEGPVHLLGHSFGGWIVFEMAARLHARGRKVASLTLIDSESPGGNGVVGRPYTGTGVLNRLIEAMQLASGKSLGIDATVFGAQDDTAQMRLLHAGMVRAGMLPQRSAVDSMRGPARAFGTALRTVYQPQHQYTGPVRLVLANDPTLDTAGNKREQQQMIEGWRKHVPDLSIWYGPGNHFTILKAPHVHNLAAWWQDGLPMLDEEEASDYV
nr:non-ribosomal peptide synthetase [Pseudomonas corrugata]